MTDINDLVEFDPTKDIEIQNEDIADEIDHGETRKRPAAGGDEGGKGKGKKKPAAEIVEEEEEEEEGEEEEEEDAEEEEEGEDDDRVKRARKRAREAEARAAAMDAANEATQARVAAMETRQRQADVSRMNADLETYRQHHAEATNAKVAAQQANDWAAAERFDQIRNNINARFGQTQAAIAEASKPVEQPPVIPAGIREWAAKHGIDVTGTKDEPSRRMAAIAIEIRKSGVDVNSPVFAEELTRRGAKLFPKRFKAEPEAPVRRKPRSGPSSGGSSSGSKQVGKVRMPKALIANYEAAGFDVSDPEVMKGIAQRFVKRQAGK